MKFKTPEVEAEYDSLNIFLKDMAEKCDFISRAVAGKEIIITRVLEPIDGSSGVHEKRRAFDVRNEHDGLRYYTEQQVSDILEYMNFKYPRNDGKPTAIHHSFGNGPFHIHIQIAASVLSYEPPPQKTSEQKQ